MTTPNAAAALERLEQKIRAGIDVAVSPGNRLAIKETISEWADELATLRASIAQQGEAVAWRVEWSADDEGNSGTFVTLDSERGAMMRANAAISAGFIGVQVRPLFTHPAAVDEAAVIRACDAHDTAYGAGDTHQQAMRAALTAALLPATSDGENNG